MGADVTQPSSWRDVYQLVQDVEGRLTVRMDDIARVAAGSVSDHELRIRAIEGSVASEARIAATTSAANAIRIASNLARLDAIEVANVARTAADAGRGSVFSYGQKLIVAVVLVTNFVVMVINLAHR